MCVCVCVCEQKLQEEMLRVLREGGVYIMVSHAPPDRRERYLDDVHWTSVTHTQASESSTVVQRHCVAVVIQLLLCQLVSQ